MTWADEVAAAREAVLPEYDQITQDILRAVPVEALQGPSPSVMWGAYFWRTHHIEVYRSAWEEMPDKDNWDVQLRDVMRHEFNHALGLGLTEHAPHEPAPVKNGWLDDGPVEVRIGDYVVTLP